MNADSVEPGRSPQGPGPGGGRDNRLRAPLGAALGPLAPGWGDLVDGFLAGPEGRALCRRLEERLAADVEVYPDRPLRALEWLTPSQVRVVIVGQDPYHGPGEAQGLAFSVAPGAKIPPSLRNIFKELEADVGVATPSSGSLVSWARRGVLLLNASLTVERDQPASHAGWGWEALTGAVVDHVAADPAPKVFMLWGAHAQRKREAIEARGRGHHLILSSNHPSPLSARRGPVPFLGSRPFSEASAFLAQNGVGPMDWALSEP